MLPVNIISAMPIAKIIVVAKNSLNQQNDGSIYSGLLIFFTDALNVSFLLIEMSLKG